MCGWTPSWTPEHAFVPNRSQPCERRIRVTLAPARCCTLVATSEGGRAGALLSLIGMTLSTRCTIFVLAIRALLVPLDAAAQDTPLPADKTLSPYFFVEGGDPAVDRLPLKDTRVDVAITGVIADVTVRQVYKNRGTRPIHARYIFPASTRAAVYGMTMTVGDVRIVARIKEREQAKTEFEAAKREGKSASLLEQSRPNVFSMNIANVLPGDAISVELEYTELLVPTGPRLLTRLSGGQSPS